MQLNPPLCIFCDATLSAWNSRSGSDQSPGTTMHGLIPPSSLVTGVSMAGRSSALRRSPSGPVP